MQADTEGRADPVARPNDNPPNPSPPIGPTQAPAPQPPPPRPVHIELDAASHEAVKSLGRRERALNEEAERLEADRHAVRQEIFSRYKIPANAIMTFDAITNRASYVIPPPRPPRPEKLAERIPEGVPA